ncbi:ATP-binding protein [Streptomyces sp. NPDC008313]|uniref:ATP-binding protein n=1 Tax=Streptomyces sp. NPDC008313 TaxID=3364826 RepID=UPI0036EDC389
MTAPIPSGDRPTLRAVAPALLLTALVAAIAVAVAVRLAPDSARTPLAWGAGTAALLLCAAVAVAAHGVHAARLARHRLDGVTRDAGRLLQERARLAEELTQERQRLTALADRERARLTEEFAAERRRLTDEHDAERQHLTGELDAERRKYAALAAEKARVTAQARQAAGARDSAVAATANAAGRMQALATGMLADLRAMEEKHSDEEVLADLLHLDHRTAQAGRLADSVAVLAGARSGRRWARPIAMESILRGAMGRIGGYQRVRVHSASEAAVAGHAAEGVMHALAELLDNAANFSPPTAEVHVYVEEVPAGVIVSVEDSGLVMGDVQLRRAEAAVAGEAELGGLTGTRLGLAVVGRLARKHGLTVSFRPSARGGTSVLVLIPQDLLTRPAAHGAAPADGSASAPAAVPASYDAPYDAPRAHDTDRPADAAPHAGQGTPRDAEEDAGQGAARGTGRPSYAAARATGDLDPDPVPTHETPAPEPAPHDGTAEAPPSSTGGLPKRRRGRTLAEAERGRPRTTAPEELNAAPADGARTTASRFGSFRQAVRGTTSGQGPAHDTTPDPGAAPPAPATPSHPEGDTTP